MVFFCAIFFLSLFISSLSFSFSIGDDVHFFYVSTGPSFLPLSFDLSSRSDVAESLEVDGEESSSSSSSFLCLVGCVSSNLSSRSDVAESLELDEELEYVLDEETSSPLSFLC